MYRTIDRKLKLKPSKSTIDRKLKRSVKYLSYAKKSGCMKFVSEQVYSKSKKLNTLDKNLKDKEVLRHLFETSNWFLFDKDHKLLDMIHMYSQ